ncbi:hypothetical protein AVEN_8656-1 [Araneus ventricosus]|uniref:Uncharacterized protein n=1 Tax=Araneus ventricosus TaxID=182803 RepID=A0A4Y2C643_ARAVE|nr:hypothetical protein AVEN_8656-1 [Araneus ventricosus]
MVSAVNMLSASGTYLTSLWAYRLCSSNRLHMVYLETVMLVDADSYQEMSTPILCLFLLVVTAKYLSFCGVLTKGRPALKKTSYISILMEPLL